MIRGRTLIQFRPTDQCPRARSFLEVLGPRATQNLGSTRCRLVAYVMPHNQAFVKRYDSPREAVYLKSRNSHSVSGIRKPM